MVNLANYILIKNLICSQIGAVLLGKILSSLGSVLFKFLNVFVTYKMHVYTLCFK